MREPSNKAYLLLVVGSLVVVWILGRLFGPTVPREDQEFARRVTHMPREQIMRELRNTPDILFEATEGMSKADLLRMEQEYHDDIRNHLNKRTPEEEEQHWEAFKTGYRARVKAEEAAQPPHGEPHDKH